MDRPKGNLRKTGKEQYYTKPEIAEYVTKIALPYLKNDLLLEPCGGTGTFVELFMKTNNKFSALDIEPKHDHVEQNNFLELESIEADSFSIITNPPFGRMSSLSVKFFNHAAKLKANYICFLVPISWRKWSTQNRLNKNYHLIKDIDLPDDHLFYGDDVDTSKKNILKCVFQIWKRKDSLREKIEYFNDYLTRAKPDNADIQIVQQGWGCGKINEEFDRNKKVNGTCYYKANKETIIKLKQFNELNKYKEFKYNSAYVDSISYSEICYTLNNN